VDAVTSLTAAQASPARLAVAILRCHGHRDLAAGLRCDARDATRLLPLLGGSSPEPGARAADHQRRRVGTWSVPGRAAEDRVR